MRITLLKSKLHGATVTGSALDYEGSISLGPELCRLARLREFERVEVYNCHNGARFSTYVILGSRPGEVVVNGAAARLVQTGDRIIVAGFAEFTPAEARWHRPAVVLLDSRNGAKLKPIAARNAGSRSGDNAALRPRRRKPETNPGSM
ncbi:MAG: aspartate 1-decarboxylase [Verrucomicrobia bacterium RIFCSPLOWO2_12_FULL_64_8]|nr:MAG: aspartate 1-decarboxylase [Verrucomicrobia bacterium RIFCSPLOWO2_12_FULL_64_8]